MRQRLHAGLEEQSYVGRIVSAEHLLELKQGIEGPHRQGLLDEELYEEYLGAFDFNRLDGVPEAKSLIIVAVPNPPTRITFAWNGQPAAVLVPPTYLHSEEIDKQVEDLLAAALASEGHSVAQAQLPKKLLAVRSGLGQYGKNNISYVSGMGSFHRLVAFFSDLPCPDDNWREPQMLERCTNCTACLRSCPTDAIASERFLVRAERCVTFHNEKPGEVPFPEWIALSAHNCLVGCLQCQRVCPENKDFREWVEEGEQFSEEETTQFVEGLPLDRLPDQTVAKLQRADLTNLLELLPRNLSVLLSRPGED
jgi:epoxyqueuosine reductase